MDYDIFLEYVDEIREHQENITELQEEAKRPLSFVDAKSYKYSVERDIQHARNEISNLAYQVVEKCGLPLNRPIAASGQVITFTGSTNQPMYAKVEDA